MTMKENQNGNFNSISFGKETDPLTFGSKDGYESNDSRMDANLTELEAKDTDDCANFEVTDDHTMGNEKGTMGSPQKAGQDELPHHLSMDNENGTVGSPRKEREGLSHQLSNWDKDTDSLSSDSSDMDKEQRSSEHANFGTVEEFEDCIQNDSRDSSSPFFTDKNVLECDLPESDVCYKEIDYEILKDICIDEGKYQKDVNVIESCTNEKPGRLFHQPPDEIDHFESDENSSLDSNSSASDQCESKEENENDCKTLVSKERLDCCPENSLEMDTADHCEPENGAEMVEPYFDATGKAETDSLEEDFNVERKLPFEDLGAQSSLVTDGGNKVMQVPDQFLNEEPVPESPAASSAEARGTGNDVQANCLLYNSKGENGSITFNFGSGEGVAVGNRISEDVEEHSSGTGHVHKNGYTENLPDDNEAKVQCTSDRVDDSHQKSLISNECVDEQSADLGGVHKDVNAENLPDARDGIVQCTSNSVDDYHEQSLISNKGNSNGGSATSYDQCVVRCEVSSCENACEGSTDHTHAVLSHSQHDMGETSFSSASMITYSGPVAFSGSLSHRSDGSTTSGKSFAFPILQSEWNSSPVRMAKADSRHFRKHKGWRSGLLCCRF